MLLARSSASKRSEWLAAMLLAIEADTGQVRQLLDEFVRETQGRAVPDRRGLRRLLRQPENFERLQSGEIGDNLMYKYRAMASFFEWSEVAGVALSVTRRLLVERGADREIAEFAALWQDFQRFEQLKHAHGRTAEEILAPQSATFRFDIGAWLAAGMPGDTRPYRLDDEQQIEFRLSQSGSASCAPLSRSGRRT